MITFACPCGKRLTAKDSSGGRMFACPACRADIQVPPLGAVDLGIDTGDGADASTAYPIALPPHPAAVVPPDFSRRDLVAAIAEGIAAERAAHDLATRRFPNSEILIGLLALGCLISIPSVGDAGGICFVIAFVAMAILARMP